jgi:hypothetical protein
MTTMTDDELNRMPWTCNLMTPEEFKDWVATRPDAGRAPAKRRQRARQGAT